MQANVACVQRSETNDARGPAHKSRTHRLLGPHKQAEGLECAGPEQRKVEATG